MAIRLKTVFLLGFSLSSALLFVIELGVSSRALSDEPPTRPKSDFVLLTAGFSSSAQRNFLLSCDKFLSFPNSQFLTEPDRLETIAACQQASSSLLKIMPTNGLAYLVAARVTIGENFLAAKDRFIKLSQSFSPYEGWLAQRRFSMMISSENSNSSDYFALIKPDLATLLSSQSGAELLAAYYIRRAGIRSELSLAVSNASSTNQARFINQIRLQEVDE